ncbi:putative lateral flagellar export/assembly protein LafU [Leminorella grimontii]|uniref:putative lateral flagellar export/assembly protein LafU n=1 Tax=Leminorella grimontii TaxID=82981 RepID=UPI00321FF4A8
MKKPSNKRDRGGHTTIIRRQIKKGHAAHHGGAWKVAFADFTLAMMALFMTLWIVNSVSQKEREKVVAAMRTQSIFAGGGIVPLSKLNVKAVAASTTKPEKPNKPNRARPSSATAKVGDSRSGQTGSGHAVTAQQVSERELGDLAADINLIAQRAHMEANLEMEIVPQGLRILIKDDKNSNMFERGSARIMPFFDSLLTELAPVLDSLDNKIIITGHTDSMRYKNRDAYNNWNLSGDRALSARRVLEKAGMPEDKVMQVSAMADRMLLDSQDPGGAENRRIEIMVLTKSASDTLYQFFGEQGKKVVQPLAEKVEEQQARVIKKR